MPKIHGDLEYQASTRAVLSGTGTALLPGITFSGDLNTGIYTPGADQLGFATAGLERLVINGEGALVITDVPSTPGTTTNKLYADGGNLYWNGIQIDAGGSFLSNIVEDTTPQLGGDLDVNDFNIVGKPAATVTSAGGAVDIVAADGGATSGNGGAVNITSGTGVYGGGITLTSGDATGAITEAGVINILGGTAASGGGGAINIFAGSSTGNPGTIKLRPGDGSSTGYISILGSNASTAANLRIHESSAVSSQYIGFKVADNGVTTSITYTLPEAPGVSGYVLSSSIGGTMAWTAPGIQNVVEDLSPQLGASLDTNGRYIKFDDNTGINDHLNNEQLIFREVVSPVNYFEMTQAVTGEAVILSVAGDDANVDLAITPKNSGNLLLDGLSWPNADGTANYAIVTDGSGTLSFASVGTGAEIAFFEYTATAGQTTFSGADDNANTLVYTAGLVYVYKNGVLLQDTTDYTATTGSTVVLASGASVTDVIQITAFSTFVGSGGTASDYTYTATASQTTFTGADDNSDTMSYTAGDLLVYLNGALLINGTDYTATNGTDVVLTVAASAGNILQVYEWGSFNISSQSGTLSQYVYTATAAQTVFTGADDNTNTLAYTAGFQKVYLNGALLEDTTDYTATNGTSITLLSAAALNDIIQITAFGTFSVANHYTKGESNNIFSTAKAGNVTSAGAFTNGPSGWSVSKTATGTYRVTHNIGIKQIVVVTVEGTGDFTASSFPTNVNYFDVYVRAAGTLTDAGFAFMAQTP